MKTSFRKGDRKERRYYVLFPFANTSLDLPVFEMFFVLLGQKTSLVNC